MKKLENIHPGDVLYKEFMIPLNISEYRLSKAIGISRAKVHGLINGKIRISADTASRLGGYFGNSPGFWLGLQEDYDLEE